MTDLQKARTAAFLNKRIWLGSQLKTWGEFLTCGIVRGMITTYTHATKKRQGEYKELTRIRRTYSLEFTGVGLFDVPKIVFTRAQELYDFPVKDLCG